jgi:hypothetical protein
MTLSNLVRERFLYHIFEEIENRATGKKELRICDEKPSRKFFVGNLSPQRDLEKLSKVITKTAPFELGLEVLVRKEDLQQSEIEITPEGAFYYRVFPTLEEQRNLHDTQKNGLFIDPLSSEDEDFDAVDRVLGSRLRIVFRKLPFKKIIIKRNLGDLISANSSTEGEFGESREIIEDALLSYEGATDKYLDMPSQEKTFDLNVPEETLKDESSYLEFLQKWYKKEIKPSWNILLKYKLSRFNDDFFKLSVWLINSASEKREKEDVDNSVFETVLKLKIHGSDFAPYVLDYLKDDYKYDGNVYANGINCSIKRIASNEIHTEHLPVFEQRKYKSNNSIQLTFKELSESPIPALKMLKNKMEEYLEETNKHFIKESFTSFGKKKYDEDVKEFRLEIERFGFGIRALESNEKAMEAFKLMNRSFINSSKGYTHWYVFQIIFIVMMIPDILAPYDSSIKNYRDLVDLIYFPTGGGKTETYLGVVVFSIFLDRLMGKKFGVSAITRFPLRLLSIQQLQRIADIFAQAERLRRSHSIIGKEDYDEFSTGYFVGGDNTPNRVYADNSKFGKENEDHITPIINGEDEKEKYKIISTCPFCGKNEVELEGDLKKLRIYHVCKNPNCSENILPIYISDFEIYRYLPTFIIGTLDKTATIGLQRFYKHIFGQVTHRCPDHGFLSGGSCTQMWNGCDRTPSEYIPVKLLNPTPSLLIQDEMHLIREGLGSYDSHYESFTDYYLKKLNEDKFGIKIIGATATISDYKLQLTELYMKNGFAFPSQGPKLKESFYAYTDENELSRLIVGIMPHNKTIIFAVLDILRYYSEVIQEYKRDPALLLYLNIGINSLEEAKKIVEDYELMLSYNLAKLEGDAVNQSIKTMVNPRLKVKGYQEINFRSMTGDVTFSDIKETLDIIENPSESAEKIDLITATSMISHGVDINMMNFMVFRGMPRNTAEYIQAYSRVGRKFPGLVFIVFNHTRERDLSYYQYFTKFHEFKDILIEPVPINRWAKFTIERTLPGIFCGSIINYFDIIAQQEGYQKLYLSNGFTEAYNFSILKEEEVLDFILNAYGVESNEKGEYFSRIIKDKVKRYFNFVLECSSKKFISFCFPSQEQPMNSLRDTDIPVEIAPTRQSYDPMLKVSSKKSGGFE